MAPRDETPHTQQCPLRRQRPWASPLQKKLERLKGASTRKTLRVVHPAHETSHVWCAAKRQLAWQTTEKKKQAHTSAKGETSNRVGPKPSPVSRCTRLSECCDTEDRI